ncbi:hypothetical protein PQR02_34885 [Paraburkholderia sediminicola]|uniref:Uncharacterized protein n=1 Tax=Paraburkholderia rhynchosiae TaxID=487049 RepID=A0ACC7N5C1_9BURK
MTNTGKVLIIGLLVVDLGVAGYLLFPKDERPPATAGAVTGIADAMTAAKVDARAGESHVVAGSVVPTTPSAGSGQLAMAPPSRPITVAPVAPPAPPAPAAPVAQPAAAAPAAPVAQPAPVAPAVTVATDAGHRAAPAANKAGARPANDTVASGKIKVPPQTAQAKPKPVLRTAQTRGQKRDESHRNGANSLSAAMTAQLVRESAQPDPSLPLPPPTSRSGPSGRGSNPVASAMTDQLVRESSKVNAPQYDKH